MLALRSIFHKITDDVFKTAKVLKLGVEDTEIKDWYMTIYLECPRNETKAKATLKEYKDRVREGEFIQDKV